ncbi:MAG: hypothetical protein J6C84_00270 [Lachnospiraceae bacterium]|nr:hypothetical protein [Lachnospiraceae bacterium]
MKKTIMGILAFAPIVLIILGFAILFIMRMGVALDEPLEGAAQFCGVLAVIFVLVAVALCYVDIVWFIVLACKNQRFDITQKVVWAIGIYMLNIFIFPVYWGMYILRDA